MIVIERVPVEDLVVKGSKIPQPGEAALLWSEEVNSNNHPKDPQDEEVAPLHYKDEVMKTHLDKYESLINYPTAWKHEFTQQEHSVLLAATSGGILCSRRPKCYAEELEEIQSRLEKAWQVGSWFMRFAGSSPKDSTVKYPITTAAQVIDCIVTSKRAFGSLGDGNNTLYFVAWDPSWDSSRELRCFVRKNKLTAISQYVWHEVGYFSTLSTEELLQIGLRVSQLVESLAPKISATTHTSDFVIDLYLTPDDTIRIVELNSFGYWLASGSALFHWLRDKAKLYNTENMVYFRVLAT